MLKKVFTFENVGWVVTPILAILISFNCYHFVAKQEFTKEKVVLDLRNNDVFDNLSTAMIAATSFGPFAISDNGVQLSGYPQSTTAFILIDQITEGIWTVESTQRVRIVLSGTEDMTVWVYPHWRWPVWVIFVYVVVYSTWTVIYKLRRKYIRPR